MRCLGAADRVTVQLFTKVKAHTPPERRQTPALSVRPAMPEAEAPFVYTYDDDGVEDTVETHGGAALDAALDDMEALLDAIDNGETPAPATPSIRPAKTTPATGRDDAYHTLAQTFAFGRDLLTGLATPAINTVASSP